MQIEQPFVRYRCIPKQCLSMDADASYTINVSDVHRLITLILKGPMTDERLVAVFDRLRKLPQFVQGYTVLFDGRSIGQHRVTRYGVFHLAQTSMKEVNRVAIVVAAGVSFGMAQAYAIRVNSKRNRVAVFTDIHEALQSLGFFPADPIS